MVVIVLVVIGLLLVAFIAVYNRLVRLRNRTDNSWAQVDVQLKRRYDLIPNLIETVKGFAGQEEKIFLGVAEARKSYFQAKSVGQKAKAASGFESALSRLLVLKETYPQLKSNESFLKLQDELAGTENRLAIERKRYNDTVKSLNTFTRKLLGRLYASLAGVEKAEYFEITEQAREVPKVDFSGGGDGNG